MCMNNNLIQLFEEARWSGLSAEERLNALRCLEAQSAMEEGRAPLDVRVMGEQEAQGGMLGYYDHRTRGMFLHPRYLHSGGLNLGDFGAGAAVRTVLHEGRHGFQWASVAMGRRRAEPTLRARLTSISAASRGMSARVSTPRPSSETMSSSNTVRMASGKNA